MLNNHQNLDIFVRSFYEELELAEDVTHERNSGEDTIEALRELGISDAELSVEEEYLRKKKIDKKRRKAETYCLDKLGMVSLEKRIPAILYVPLNEGEIYGALTTETALRDDCPFPLRIKAPPKLAGRRLEIGIDHNTLKSFEWVHDDTIYDPLIPEGFRGIVRKDKSHYSIRGKIEEKIGMRIETIYTALVYSGIDNHNSLIVYIFADTTKASREICDSLDIKRACFEAANRYGIDKFFLMGATTRLPELQTYHYGGVNEILPNKRLDVEDQKVADLVITSLDEQIERSIIKDFEREVWLRMSILYSQNRGWINNGGDAGDGFRNFLRLHCSYQLPITK